MLLLLCVQVNAVSSGMVTKTSTTGGGLSGPGYGPHTHMADSGSLNMASQGMLGFPQQRSSDVRTSQLQLSTSHGQHGGKVMGAREDMGRGAFMGGGGGGRVQGLCESRGGRSGLPS